MNFTTIKAALYSWAATVVGGGVTVYWGEPNGPRPANPSVRLKLIAGPTMVGLDELRDVAGDDDAFKVVGTRVLTLSVTAYGDAALQLVSDLQTSISNPEATAGLSAANLAASDTSAPRDLTALLETKYEQRYQFDVTVLATEELTTEPGVIETVVGTSSIGGVDGDFSADNGG